MHVVSQSDLVNIRHVSSPLHRSTHGVSVFFADKYDRKLPEHGHIKCLVQRSLAYRAISQVANTNIICSFILFGKRDSCAQGDLTTYNAMPPKKIMFFGKQVHGATLPFGTSGSLGKKLSHDLAGWYSIPQRMSVIPEGGHDRIFLPDS